jgi:ribosomal-protein-alanine N-acetyltransferase
MINNFPLGPFKTNRLILRALKDSDRENIYRQFSDLDMCRYFADPPCTRQEADEILAHYTNEEEAKEMRWAIIHHETGAFIGTLGFHYFDKFNGKVEIGYDIWKEHWQQGYMREALPVLLQICFEELRVSVIYAYTHTENKASQNLLKSFGFQQDGVLRAWIKNAGVSQDQCAFSLLKEEGAGFTT